MSGTMLIPKGFILGSLLSFAALSGCMSNDSPIDYDALGVDASSATSSITPRPAVTLPRASNAPYFDDAKPHEWKRLTPWHYPIHGTDVSKYQGIIDWGRVRDSGISFAFIKATEGGDHLDEAFQRNWQGAAEAGIMRGAYHFYYWCRSGAEQARWFIRNVPKDTIALPPVLDLEWNHKSASCRVRPTDEEIHKQVKAFLSIIEAHYGKRPIIYTTVDFFDRVNLEKMKGYSFWLRSVAGHPEEKYGAHPWMFWQYTGTGRIPGIENNVDINVFYGSKEQWQQMIAPLTLRAYSNRTGY